MREILFRGKRLDNGSWETGSLVVIRAGCHDESVSIADKMTGYHTPVKPETVGQYTGLADMNGTMIFEGDVVDILPENEEVGVIRWRDDTARFVIEGDGFTADFDNYFGCDLEVIDNVYDNPAYAGGVR